MSQVTTNGAVTRTFGYDAAGNITTDANSGTTLTYTYEGLERLAIRAVTNTVLSGTTHLVYDQSGRVLAEIDASSGNTVREYVWVDDLPLAVVSGVNTSSPAAYYVHAAHLNRPILMTDPSTKAVVWKAVYKPFAEVYSITGSATLDARFPGQWFQPETGLHCNWHRHYDPTTGMYTQPDPLGLFDGPSVYEYSERASSARVAGRIYRSVWMFDVGTRRSHENWSTTRKYRNESI